MDQGHVCSPPPDSIEILVRKVENGFVLEIAYPPDMLSNQSADMAKDMISAFGSVAFQDQPENPADAMKILGRAIEKVTKRPKPLRRAREEYIFPDVDGMLKFIRETFVSVEHKEV